MNEKWTTFDSLVVGGNGSFKETSRGDKSTLEHNVTHATGDAILDRLLFLSDNQWLGKDFHRFTVAGKSLVKIKVLQKVDKFPDAKLFKVCDKEARKWSKDFRKILSNFSEFFDRFLTSSMLSMLGSDETQIMAAISLLFEIARIPLDRRPIGRQNVARAIKVVLSGQNKDDLDDLADLFVKEESDKVNAYISIMRRNNEPSYMTDMIPTPENLQSSAVPVVARKKTKSKDILDERTETPDVLQAQRSLETSMKTQHDNKTEMDSQNKKDVNPKMIQEMFSMLTGSEGLQNTPFDKLDPESMEKILRRFFTETTQSKITDPVQDRQPPESDTSPDEKPSVSYDVATKKIKPPKGSKSSGKKMTKKEQPRIQLPTGNLHQTDVSNVTSLMSAFTNYASSQKPTTSSEMPSPAKPRVTSSFKFGDSQQHKQSISVQPFQPISSTSTQSAKHDPPPPLVSSSNNAACSKLAGDIAPFVKLFDHNQDQAKIRNALLEGSAKKAKKRPAATDTSPQVAKKITLPKQKKTHNTISPGLFGASEMTSQKHTPTGSPQKSPLLAGTSHNVTSSTVKEETSFNEMVWPVPEQSVPSSESLTQQQSTVTSEDKSSSLSEGTIAGFMDMISSFLSAKK